MKSAIWTVTIKFGKVGKGKFKKDPINKNKHKDGKKKDKAHKEKVIGGVKKEGSSTISKNTVE